MESLKTTLAISTPTENGFLNVQSFKSNHRYFSVIKIGLSSCNEYSKEYEIRSTEKLPGINLQTEHDTAINSVINHFQSRFIESTLECAFNSVGENFASAVIGREKAEVDFDIH